MDIDRLIEEALASDQMAHVFQPIWRLADGALLGFEALARFEGVDDPDRVFDRAKASGRGIALDRLSMREALRQAARLPGFLFINVQPENLRHSKPPYGTVGPVMAAFRHRTAVVADLTQAPGLDDVGVARLKRRRLKVAAYMTADHEILPGLDFLRIRAKDAMSIGLGVKTAQSIGAQALVVGIEDRAEVNALVQMGIRYGQGNGLGAPASAADWLKWIKDHLDDDQIELAAGIYWPAQWPETRRGAPVLGIFDVGEMLYTHLPIPICIVDRDGKIAGLNLRGEKFWGVYLEKVAGRPFEEALGIRGVVPAGQAKSRRQVCRIQRTGGEEIPTEVLWVEMEHRDRHYAALMVVSDLPETDGFYHRFAIDAVTGLPTRIWWEQEKERWDRDDGSVAFFDLNGLKGINDIFGHSEGDEALRRAGQAFRDLLPEGAVAVRYGGDEFLLVWPKALAEKTRQLAIKVGQRLEILATGFRVPLRLTFGVSPYRAGDLTAGIRLADHELLRKKGLWLPTASGSALILTTGGRQPLWNWDEALSEIGFETFGSSYPEVVRAIHPDTDSTARTLVQWFNPEPGSAVVEVACGHGRLAVEGGLADRIGPQGQLLLTDASGVLLGLARRRIPNTQHWVNFLVAFADSLPIASASADWVIGTFFLYCTNPPQALAEMMRVVRPGGFMGLAESYRWHWPEEIAAAMDPLWTRKAACLGNLRDHVRALGMEVVRERVLAREIVIRHPEQLWQYFAQMGLLNRWTADLTEDQRGDILKRTRLRLDAGAANWPEEGIRVPWEALLLVTRVPGGLL